MPTTDIHRSLAVLLSELVRGAATTGGFILNAGDAGLLTSLDQLSAGAASATSHGGASIAAHVAHLQYGLSLMNRWAAGENPFESADWGEAWKTTTVSEAEWAGLRQGLRDETGRWIATLGEPREVSDVELNGMIASVAHLAYHLGAIRQIDPAARGPRDPSAVATG